jgi:two-component system, OmpR family, phosphate regulon sensor histidine kinase PhoR
MNTGPYKIIMLLLALSVLVVLSLQTYWIYTFYRQQETVFNNSVYSAIEQITKNLNLREHFQMTKVIVENTNNSTSHKAVFHHNKKLNLRGTNTGKTAPTKRSGGRRIIIKSSNSQSDDTARTTIEKIVYQDSRFKDTDALLKHRNIEKIQRSIEKIRELNDFADAMQLEIVSDGIIEKNPDTLKALINKVLLNKGLHTNFNFSLREIHKKKTQILSQSSGFKEDQYYYQGDLSANKVFSNNLFLWLQFPEEKNMVIAGMKFELTLSLFFSALILALFYRSSQLIIKQKKLTELKNDFVNNMTHELKTPIATMSLAIEGLSNPTIKNDPIKFKDYQNILKEENQRLKSHVDRVLQLALLEQDSETLNKTPIDLVKLTGQIINMHQLQSERINANISLTSSEPVIEVCADETAMAAVFNNLMDNALKYAANSCTIQIDIKKAEGLIEINFTDNGISIPEVFHHKVFEKFFRVQKGNLHNVKGFGLGLSYVKSVIEAHAGSIEIVPEQKAGTTFLIKLKAHEKNTAC